ncbi:Electron transport complex subunit RsxE [Candidatus Hartigia pinicola]|nr:Electron transport complex subunit RsxE [Candidatus Hartigia pinicola]
MYKILKFFAQSLWKNDSVLVKLPGLYPFLLVSSTTIHALGLGFVITLVIVFTNISISALHRWIPHKIRIPIYIIIIASIVNAIQMLINVYAFELYKAIGIFIPLLITNCTIIDRAETYASKNSISRSFIDGIVIGLNITLVLFFLGAIREISGNGTLFNDADLLLGSWASSLKIKVFDFNFPFLLALMPPGTFISLALILAGKNLIDEKIKQHTTNYQK